MKETRKREADLKAGYADEGPHGIIYRPLMLYAAITGAIIVGLIFGVSGYLIAVGTWPIVDLGQLSAPFPGTTAVTFAGVGVALGALIGWLLVFKKVLKHGGSNKSRL
ncbi:hypothetical protein [Salinimicrobium oceani]|uniref:Uncharacterized protein n=1 Tax=Salinimicrobium oceani TaxID=2722702 RepID=A0ABX1CVF4_9FLAO|nr:hypothetical protein [Salinimicrobium oceani]NJW52270.1 hypothetical protein [Salinimicrobium oceani]